MMIFAVLVPVILVVLSIRIIEQYQNSVVFTLGRYTRTLKPGLNFIVPIIEWTRTIDMRVLTRDIPKQQVITKDNVPVTINGVVYFRVLDASTAIIKVQDYNYAISQYAQAALRDVVGGMSFDDLLAERQKIGEEIEQIVKKESGGWGLEVSTIKIQDVDVPEDLKKMMSRQASAEREKRATITKAEGDKLAAVNLAEAARIMGESPGAMQLRTLQTVDGLGPTPSNTVVMAIPVELYDLVKSITKEKRKEN
jgi:regulator of protease activity HflC (stomatin/prohibitin superfamily)